MDRQAAVSEHGFTAIEFLLYASIIALLVSFAVPIIGTAIHKSEIEQAIKITEESVEQARRTARMYKTNVLMHIKADHQHNQRAITLTIPEMQRDLVLNEVKKEFQLPGGVDIVSGDAIIHFDPNGEVNLPARVVVVSNQSEDISQLLMIE